MSPRSSLAAVRAAALSAALACPALARAQFPPAPPPPAPVIAPAPFDSMMGRVQGQIRVDTAKTDTGKVKEIVKWAETDPVMDSLMQLSGYQVTKYQGTSVVLAAPKKDISIDGNGAIDRNGTILVADTIFYSDSAHIMQARGPANDTIVLRDPSQGTSDIYAQNFLVYDLRTHRGIVSTFATSEKQTGQTWYVAGHEAAFVGDTSALAHNTEMAIDGSITSCNLAVPHYHFQSTEIKVVSKTIMVARPAVLYLADVPVLWMPFIFQDMRPGRHSGMLTPRFGIADIVRTTPTYRRQIENVGYYFAINDYTDALVALGWRSGANSPPTEPGWTRVDGRWRFRWLDRFIASDLNAGYVWYTNGSDQILASWRLGQQFSQNNSLSANLNYTSSTQLYRYDAYTVAAALAAITSSLNYADRFGPFALSLGGTRTQHSGQSEIDYDFPTFTVTSQPVNISKAVNFTPSFSFTNTVNQAVVSPLQQYAIFPGDSLDSAAYKANQRRTAVSLQSPFRFGNFALPISIRLNDTEIQLPQNYVQYDFFTGQPIGNITYAKTFRTDLYWDTGVALPSLFQGTWNLTPFVSIANADGSSGYWVRTQISGGVWVAQSKTIQGGLAIQPTWYGFWPGFGPFARIRHSIQPRVAFTYAPATNVPDAFLRALNYTRAGYLGGLEQSSLSLNLLNTIEAKLKPKGDTVGINQNGNDKIKLLTLNLSPLTYDFIIARKIGRGITTPNFHWDASSDLLPGLTISADYSLFAGNPISDTAKFDPFRTNLSISFNLGHGNNPFAAFSRIFGGGNAADTVGQGAAAAIAQGGAFIPPPIAGPVSSRVPLGVTTGGGWNLSISFTSSRNRPVTGANVHLYDPKQFCAPYISDAITYQKCLLAPPPSDTLFTTTAGAPIIVPPAQATLRANASFDLSPHWAVQWTTGYDFVAHRFADNVLSLQRSMHDWRALFSFLQAPNGNFAFNFTVALIAEPDLHFDYNRRNERPIAPTTP